MTPALTLRDLGTGGTGTVIPKGTACIFGGPDWTGRTFAICLDDCGANRARLFYCESSDVVTTEQAVAREREAIAHYLDDEATRPGYGIAEWNVLRKYAAAIRARAGKDADWTLTT